MDCTPVFKNVLNASRTLTLLEPDAINKILIMLADAAIDNTELILAENKKDLALINVSDPNYDRLLLTASRINTIASDLRNVAGLQGST